MLRFSTLVALALALATGAVAADPAWPGFRGPEGSGRSAAALPPGEQPLALAIVWRQELGSGYSGIAVAEGALVTAAAGGEHDVVVAHDPDTGRELWRQALGPAYIGHDGSHDGPIATPAIAAGRVFALGARGELRAFELASGKPLWQASLVDDLGCEQPFYGFASSPAVAADTVVLQACAASAGSVAGFDAATGKLRWRAVEDEVAFESPIVTEIDGRLQVVALGAKRVAGLDPATGAILWSLEHAGQPSAMGAQSASPLPLGGGRMLLKHDADRSALLAVERGEAGLVPTIRATAPVLARSYSPPTYWADTIYGYSARFLSAVDAQTGEQLWRSREPGDGFLVAAGGQLVVLTKEGSLHVGAASRSGWQEMARAEVFDDLAWTPPAVAGNRLYLRSLGGIARVDLVRGGGEPARAPAPPTLPAPLAALAAEIAAAEKPGPVVDRFLASRELPLVDGEEAIFVWRGEPAAGESVAVAGDMIGMRREEPMQRLAGTDLWWWATRLDRHARISYVFFVGDVPTPDPTHARRVRSTVLGPDMNWARGKPLEMSWFAMPDWPGQARLESFEVPVQAPGEDGKPTPASVRVHVWLPPGYRASAERYPVVYVHHAAARTVGGWPETLERVVGDRVAPLIAVFVDPARMRDGDKVFAEQVVPAIDARYRTRAEREGRANVAMGWSGASITMLTVAQRERFGALAVQSLYGLESTFEELSAALAGVDGKTPPLRIYYEWGRWDLVSPHEEMNMRDAARQALALLRQHGFAPIGGEVWDSTDWASWRNRTGLLLEVLFPASGAPGPPAELSRWLTGE